MLLFQITSSNFKEVKVIYLKTLNNSKIEHKRKLSLNLLTGEIRHRPQFDGYCVCESLKLTFCFVIDENKSVKDFHFQKFIHNFKEKENFRLFDRLI